MKYNQLECYSGAALKSEFSIKYSRLQIILSISSLKYFSITSYSTGNVY